MINGGVLGLGLISTSDYYNSVQKAGKDAKLCEGRTQFVINDQHQRPHATVIFVNTAQENIDTFIHEAKEIAESTRKQSGPITTKTTQMVLGEDGMYEEQLQKTRSLQELQDLAIFRLVPLAIQRILSNGLKVIWPEKNPPGKPLDETIPQLPQHDPEHQQYKAIGYDEASGTLQELKAVLAGQSRTENQFQEALKSQVENPFSRFRPHVTYFRINPNTITLQDQKALNRPADGRLVTFDYLVVSPRGANGTFGKPIAAFNLDPAKPIDTPFPYEGSDTGAVLPLPAKNHEHQPSLI
jgi:hypothetical protein